MNIDVYKKLIEQERIQKENYSKLIYQNRINLEIEAEERCQKDKTKKIIAENKKIKKEWRGKK
jgi:hypothetical protein